MRAPLLSKFGGSFQGCRQQRGWRSSEQTQSLDARSPQRDVRAQGGPASALSAARLPGDASLAPGSPGTPTPETAAALGQQIRPRLALK